MKIYVSHSTSFDYQTELYAPLRNSELNLKHEFILPHEKQATPQNTKKIIENCDVLIAEVSLPSTGQGIELGWANSAGVRILGFFAMGSKPSGSLSIVVDELIDYSDSADFISKLPQLL